MINFIICEDDCNIANIIKKYINEFLEENIIKGQVLIYTSNFDEVISYASQYSNSTNVYFFDVNLNHKYNGFTLAKQIRKYDYNGYIIFVTGHIELALKVFQYKLKALDYIPKYDVNLNQKVLDCLDIIINEIDDLNSDYHNLNKLMIKSGTKIYNISLDDIIYIDTNKQNRKTTIHTISNKIELYDTLSNLEKKLDSSFYRCHRSYIVNLNHIKYISTEKNNMYICVSNNEQCLLGPKYLKGVIDYVRVFK